MQAQWCVTSMGGFELNELLAKRPSNQVSDLEGDFYAGQSFSLQNFTNSQRSDGDRGEAQSVRSPSILSNPPPSGKLLQHVFLRSRPQSSEQQDTSSSDATSSNSTSESFNRCCQSAAIFRFRGFLRRRLANSVRASSQRLWPA